MINKTKKTGKFEIRKVENKTKFSSFRFVFSFFHFPISAFIFEMSEAIISVENLSKRYVIGHQREKATDCGTSSNPPCGIRCNGCAPANRQFLKNMRNFGR